MDGKECFFDCGRMGFEYLLKEKESVEDRDAPEYLCRHSTANVYTFAYGSWAPEFWRCKIPLNYNTESISPEIISIIPVIFGMEHFSWRNITPSAIPVGRLICLKAWT